MLKCNIEISIMQDNGKFWSINAVESCDIFKSADVLLDSCKIVLPVRTKWDNSSKIPDIEKSWVVVSMGYDSHSYNVFHGFVTYLQVDEKLTIWCSGELAKYKYRELKEPYSYGVSFPEILKLQGVNEPISTDMRDKPWYFQIERGSIFGLFEKLKRLRIHPCLISDKDDEPLLVLSRRYVVALDRNRSFEFGRNIISFRDAIIKNDLADDLQFNNDTVICKQFHLTDAEGRPDVVDAVVQVQWPEWRGRRIDLTFWGIDWDNKAQQEAHDASVRASVIRGHFELAQLLTFGADFVEPHEKISVKGLDDVAGDYIVVSNHISFGIDGIRQLIKLI